MRRIDLPLDKKIIKSLKIGEWVLLSGRLLTARDAAHKRLVDVLKNGKKLPVSIKGEAIYYTGPTPARGKEVIGACGPTTSARMDPFTPALLRHGLIAMIGKGERSKEVATSIKKYGAVYFVTIGGAGAYLSERVKKNKIVAYSDLEAEAMRELIVEDFPAIVSIV